jgi:hypothetical protein
MSSWVVVSFSTEHMHLRARTHQTKANSGGADVTPDGAADAAEYDVWQVVRADRKALRSICDTTMRVADRVTSSRLLGTCVKHQTSRCRRSMYLEELEHVQLVRLRRACESEHHDHTYTRRSQSPPGSLSDTTLLRSVP